MPQHNYVEHKKFSKILLLCLSISVGVFFLLYKKIDLTPSWDPSGAVKLNAALTLAHKHQVPNSAETCCLPDNQARESVVSLKKVISLAALMQSQEPLPDQFEVIDNASSYLERAKRKDPIAAMALYSTVVHCSFFAEDRHSPFTTVRPGVVERLSNNCYSISAEDAKNKDAWLLDAADGGRTDAQLTYANAIASKEMLREYSKLPATADDVVAIERSKRYLFENATKGLEEAYLQLAIAFDTGQYGQKDAVLAYAYTAALKQMQQSAQHEVFLVQLQAKLRHGDLIQAEQRIREILGKCCVRE